ncbi:MAG: site-specific DNA-methyltransferase, partial [Gammaproteobacteria bacterium]|nr:site-specific DNA-methyltransferase [Gammaproteobacteria bacterium]
MSGPDAGTLYYGDCLDWMGRWDDQSVDLIYLDPPFNSKADYNILYSARGGADAQFRAFSDTWAWDEAAADRYAAYEGAPARLAHDAIVGLRRVIGPSGMLAYLTYMAERLEHMQRLLKSTGSIYLHCDPTASHYLKIVMDAIFGYNRFRRECIWDIAVLSGFKTQARNWIRGHDTVLYYTRSEQFTFNRPRQPHRPEYLARFNKVDDQGRRYFDGRGQPRYLDDVVKKGKAVGDVWSDIMSFQQIPTAKEKLGYPTQKPLSLLERIINASSDRDHLILDPFCGCGTTIEAAQRLGRRW